LACRLTFDPSSGQLSHKIPQHPCDNWPFGAGLTKRGTHSGHDDLGTIPKKIAADPDDQPAQRGKFGVTSTSTAFNFVALASAST
jgi:hypothetical protein